jgi:hypothetical protein
VSLPTDDPRLVTAWPLLDTGAARTVFDGAVAEQVGWSGADITDRAEDAQPLTGFGRGVVPLVGYAHRLTCHLPRSPRFAVLSLRVSLTPPYTLRMPVPDGRIFFQQAEVALVEAEQRVSLRFRGPSVVHKVLPAAP